MNDIGTLIMTGCFGMILGILIGVFITFQAYKSYIKENQEGNKR